MKEKLTKNLGIKLLSVPLAAIIWFVIINIDDPISTKNIMNVPVEITNESYIKASGQVYDIVEGGTVTVTVKAKRSIRDKIRSSDLRVTANLAEITNFNRVELVAECTKYTSENVELSVKPKMLTVTLENSGTTTVPIQISTTGVVDSGYYIDAVKASPNMLEISGPESTIDKIEEARVVVDVSGHQEDFSQDGLAPRVYDEKGKEIDSSRLSFSHTSIRVKVKVLPTRTVPVQVKVEGNPAIGYSIGSVEFGPEQIELAGDMDVLSKIYSLPIVVDINGVSADVEKDIDLSAYIPEKTKQVGEISNIAVHVKIEKLATKDMLLREEDITVNNLSEDYTMHYSLTSLSIPVTVMGDNADLEKLTLEDMETYIDLKGLKPGTHLVPLNFNLKENYQISGSPVVTVVIEEIVPEEEPEETPDGNPEETPQPEESETPDEVPNTEEEEVLP